MKSSLRCVIVEGQPDISRCQFCVQLHVKCSNYSDPPPSSSIKVRSTQAAPEKEASTSNARSRAKSPSILAAITSPFKRTKADKSNKATDDVVLDAPPSSTQPKPRPSHREYVGLPPPSVPSTRRPRPSPPSHSTSVFPSRPGTVEAPFSPYPSEAPVPSSTSLTSYATTSYSSIGPDDPEYPYELERLQINYRASQESLRVEQERAAAERQVYVRERSDREARHRQELEAARRGQASDTSKGKRRE